VTPASPDVNNIAAATASAAPDPLLICMIVPSLVVDRSEITAQREQRPGHWADYYSKA
jgi:hypothetical protein